MSVEERNWAWARLRLLRSSPPGRAARSKARAELFSASLEQCEQLMAAALNVGSAARPLPLFYALSQATRAICAVRLKNEFLISRHGLKWPRQHGDDRQRIMHRQLEPNASKCDAFTRLCYALGCDSLGGPVALGAVWRALPDLGAPDLPAREAGWFNAMYIAAAPVFNPAWIEIYAAPSDTTRNLVEWTHRLKRYPSLAGWSPTPATADPTQASFASLGSPPTEALSLRLAAPASATPGHREAHIALTGQPHHGRADRRFAIPALPRGEQLAPLALWWLVLFALSNLARYEPDTWVQVLNLDSPLGLAAPLEDCLSVGIDVLPHLVLEALLARHVPLFSYPER